MKPIDRNEVLGLADYETIRERFRSRVVAEKKRRRVQLGPNVSVLFENRDTVLLQIQEMLRAERITRPGAIQHEIDTYNENLPGDDELSCTLMIEIAETAERDAFLRGALGFEKTVSLVVRGGRLPAHEVARDAGVVDRTTAVHYLKFKLPGALAEELRTLQRASSVRPQVELRVDHPIYVAAAVLPPETVLELAEDSRT